MKKFTKKKAEELKKKKERSLESKLPLTDEQEKEYERLSNRALEGILRGGVINEVLKDEEWKILDSLTPKVNQRDALKSLHSALKHRVTTVDIDDQKKVIEVIKKAASAAFDVASTLEIKKAYEPARGIDYRQREIAKVDRVLKRISHNYEQAMSNLSRNILNKNIGLQILDMMGLALQRNNHSDSKECDYTKLAIVLNMHAFWREINLPKPKKRGYGEAVLNAFERATESFDSKYQLLHAYGEMFFEKDDREDETENLRNRLKELQKRHSRARGRGTNSKKKNKNVP